MIKDWGAGVIHRDKERKMKNKLKIIVVLLAVTMFTSCSQELEIKNRKNISLVERELNVIAVNDTTNTYAVRLDTKRDVVYVIDPVTYETVYEVSSWDMANSVTFIFFIGFFLSFFIIGAIFKD